MEKIFYYHQVVNYSPFTTECKNQERLNIWESLEQAESNAGQHIPLVVFKRNRSKTYISMEINDLMRLLSEKQQSSN